MRFLSMIRINEKSGLVPSEQLMQDMGKLMDEMTRDGVLDDSVEYLQKPFTAEQLSATVYRILRVLE